MGVKQHGQWNRLLRGYSRNSVHWIWRIRRHGRCARRRRAHELARFRATAAGDVIPQDLIEYGFMPELIARLPVLMQYRALDVPALREILMDAAQGPLRVWQQYYDDLGLELELSPEVGEVVAQYAFALRLGARGLAKSCSLSFRT